MTRLRLVLLCLLAAAVLSLTEAPQAEAPAVRKAETKTTTAPPHPFDSAQGKPGKGTSAPDKAVIEKQAGPSSVPSDQAWNTG